MNFLKLSKEKLDLNSVNDLIVHASCGGVSFFVGTTRDSFEDKQVMSLEYEAYDSMALKELGQICEQMRTNWTDIKHIAIHHRLGLVPVKEASVIIGVSSPHRQTSLEAVQYAIDALKESVPIWKKEKYNDTEVNSQQKSLKRKILPPINFDECPVAAIPISKNLIQIHVDEHEVNRRVNCFVDRKREEININNIQDFIEPANVVEEEFSCARVNSSIFRNKNSNTHLRVHRVKNEYGPQTKLDHTNALDKLMENPSPTKIKQENKSFLLNDGLNERLGNAESFLGIQPVKTIFARVKAIEDRILYLESVSPEYNHFMNHQTLKSSKVQKKTHTIGDLDVYIQELKEKVPKP